MENKPNENELPIDNIDKNKDNEIKNKQKHPIISFIFSFFEFIFALLILLSVFITEIAFPIFVFIIVLCFLFITPPNINPSVNEKPILLDEVFINNIKDKCIINDLKIQIDNMIKSDNEDTKLTFDNYQIAKGKCDKENDEKAKKDEKDKHNQYLEKTKELLDKVSQDIN